MGYKRNPKIYKLTWQDGEYAGLEVSVRTMSMGQLVDSQSGKGASGIEGTVELLAERIVGWNLEDEAGQPVPPTLAAMREEDDDLIIAIIAKWREAVAGVEPPLPQSSPAGEPSPVESIPMAPLSGSLAS
ncbi:hypothetical protein [Streptomyces sp. NPDC059597]|uniref:hypothetical protein n=1 Tax=Streptomyces sp. NPDC059597 TaxID=3346879 RepID=UPI0036B88FC0